MPNIVPKSIEDFSEFLPTQYSDSTNLSTFLGIYLSQVQELENANVDLNNLSTDIDTAFGYQLDIIGKFLGALREGRSDVDYRIHIKLTSAINRSKGQPENIISLLEALTPSTNIRYWEHYPASIYLYLDGVTSLDPAVKDTVAKMLPAACSIGYIGFSTNALVHTPYDTEYESVGLLTDIGLPITTDLEEPLQVTSVVFTGNLPKSYLAESEPVTPQIHGILPESI